MSKIMKTFEDKKNILNVLALGKREKNRWMTTREIVDVATIMGWTTPMNDANRKAVSHPYSKILSMMTDNTNETYFAKNVKVRVGSGKGKKYEFRLA